MGQSILRSLGRPSVRFIHSSEDHLLRETDPGRLATSHQHLPPAIYCYGFLSSPLHRSPPRNTWLVGDPFASPDTGPPYPPSRTMNGMEKSAFAWVSLSLKSALFRTLTSAISRRSDHDFVLGRVVVSLWARGCASQAGPCPINHFITDSLCHKQTWRLQCSLHSLFLCHLPDSPRIPEAG